MENKKLALLIDFENLIIGLTNHDPDSKKVFSAQGIIDYLESNYGKIACRKAFADWSNIKYRRHSQDMMRCGIEMLHVVRSGFNSKTQGEIMMTVQAMDCLTRYPEVDTFVLVTGDADFMPLISYIKSAGRKVIGMGSDCAASNALQFNCDEYLFCDYQGVHKERIAVMDKGPVINALKSIIGAGGIYVDDIEEELAEMMPEFNPADFGCEDILDFLESIPSLVRIDNTLDEVRAFWVGGQGMRPQPKYIKNDFQMDQTRLPLGEYMRATRWFIQDGQVREEVLANIYKVLSVPGTLMPSDELRRAAVVDMPVEDKAWQGTIFSLVCGSCLWEKQEVQELPLHMRRLSLFNKVRDLEDFFCGYYTSLFHKAFLERQDLTPRSMAELMHPEDVEGHLPLFEKVFNDMNDRR